MSEYTVLPGNVMEPSLREQLIAHLLYRIDNEIPKAESRRIYTEMTYKDPERVQRIFENADTMCCLIM